MGPERLLACERTDALDGARGEVGGKGCVVCREGDAGGTAEKVMELLEASAGREGWLSTGDAGVMNSLDTAVGGGVFASPSMLFRSGLGFCSEALAALLGPLLGCNVSRALSAKCIDPTAGGSGSCKLVAILFAPSSRMFPLGDFASPGSDCASCTVFGLLVVANVVGLVLALVLLWPVTNDLNVLLVGASEPFEFLLDPVNEDEASIVDGVCGLIDAFASAPSSSPGCRYSSVAVESSALDTAAAAAAAAVNTRFDADLTPSSLLLLLLRC